MQQTLTSLLFPEYRRRVLGLLLLRPEESLHGRELARRTRLPAGTLTRDLNRLAEVGLLKREKRGNQQVYSVDRTCPVFEEVASILRKTSGLADVLVEALAPVATQIQSAFVFGSIARGQETPGSDIDLLVIGDLTFGALVALMHSAQTTLGREINPKLFKDREFRSKARKEPFLRDMLAKPKIFLIGNEHDLTELARQEP
jgi:predicted nucleotidyltransferase